MAEVRYEIFQDKQGLYRWQLIAANGEIVAQSEAYLNKENAKRGAFDTARASAVAKVVER